jgi:hypothetical protein
MLMYPQPWQDEPALTGHLRIWLRANTSWYLRPYEAQAADVHYASFWTIPPLRQASADEIAAEILNDPALREALAFLSSQEGQRIEDAVLQLSLPDWQAQVLTAGLTRAWQIVLDENRPIWQRADVLLGAGIGVVLLLALTSRSKH